ncbi:MAG: histidinol-phosphate transaminase [Methanocorpusculum parvum]|nr:histidinol-phosphate transaminase [Methanocorpusculum parvum]
MKPQIRSEYNGKGYVYAASAKDIAEETGFEKIARLASNENPFEPSPEIRKAAVSALNDINRYPDPSSALLREAIRRHIYDAPVVVSGSGMDGVIETVIRVVVAPGDKVAVASPTFSVYGLAAKAASAEIVNIPAKEDFTIDTDAFIEGAKDAKLSFLCTPNNPTGTTIPAEDVKRILENISGFLFLDCAYIEFADEDYYHLLSYENLIIGRTLSKVYGLAGLRIGYAFVPEWFVGPYMAGVTPFSLNCVSEAAGAAALENPECRNALVSHVRSWRKRFEEEIPFPVLPSGANFVLVNTAPIKSDDAVRQLQKAGVLVRSCSSFPGLGETYIRVSVGADWENERFLSAVKNLC